MSDKKARLQGITEAVQQRWGPNALRTLAVLPGAEFPHTSTGFSNLDHALGIGGVPCGRITEIQGVPTSGMSTLGLKIMASAQAKNDMAVYIDPGETFDPDYARRCGINLDQLLLVRPGDPIRILEITRDLIASKGVGALVVGPILDRSASIQSASGALARLNTVVGSSPCALVVLSVPHPQAESGLVSSPLAYFATVRLQVEKGRWLRRQGDVRGYRANITILKNKLAAPGRRLGITIGFDGTVKGDGA